MLENYGDMPINLDFTTDKNTDV